MTLTKIVDHEALGQGVVRKWLDHEQIMVLQMPQGARREAIDVWFDTLIEAGRRWDRTQPFIALHDLREMGFSYYFRERAVELGIQTPKDITGRVAVVMPKGPIGQLLAKLAKLSLTKSQGNVSLKPFTDYDRALAWLREGF